MLDAPLCRSGQGASEHRASGPIKGRRISSRPIFLPSGSLIDCSLNSFLPFGGYRLDR